MAWIVLVAGGHASGKRTVCNGLKQALDDRKGPLNVTIELQDMAKYQQEKYTPNVDFDSLLADIDDIEKRPDTGHLVVLVHGNYALYEIGLRDKASIKVFVDCDADARLSQWILRDTSGETRLEDILDEYLRFCRPEYIKYIDDSKKYADVLLPRGRDSLGLAVLATALIDRVAEDVNGRPSNPLESWPHLRKDLFDDNENRYYTPI